MPARVEAISKSAAWWESYMLQPVGVMISARLQGPLLEDAVLSTSGGSVTAWVEEGTGFQLDARTSGGGVKAEGVTIKIESGSLGRSKLVGEVNGGGPTLKLRSSGGNINVRTS